MQDTYSKSGNHALRINGMDNLAFQTWEATQGWRYATSAEAFTPAADRLAGAENLHAVVQLQFLDASSNLLKTYESPWFTTNIAAGAWSNLQAVGAAPSGSRYGRTLVGLFGDADGFAGSVWFDDATQTVVSTTGTVAGLLGNPGFDDGPTGNAYDLQEDEDLPFWEWLGGTNAGFVTDSYKYDNGQSLAITYPENMMAQSFVVSTGYTYAFEGYLYTPAAEKLEGSAYGVLIVEYYQDGALISSAESDHFTSSSPSNEWVRFSVSHRAPWAGNTVTCRVLCAIMGSSGGYDGAVYFDGLSVTGSYVGATNVQAGSVWNPGFEYTEPGTVLEGVDSWTALGDAGVISDDYSRSGDNSLRIYGPETLISQDWEATEGWKYASAAWAYTPVADRLAGDPELHAVVIMQFFDGTGTNMLISYESPWFTTGTVAGVWSNLEVIGVAPRGSVYGRTLVGLLGPSDGFGGSVYFDDVTQRVVSTSGTMSGLLHNPGFDDGPSGNAYDLQETNDLPYWQWTGGTNAGFVARDYKKNAEQAFVITYPLNNVAQDWTAEGGRAYKAEGYLFTPASAKFDTDGTSFGRIELSFFLDGDDEADVDSAAVSASFGADQSADTWVYFAVTGIAPYASAVTGRVTCTIACTGDPEEDEDLAGVIYFDQLTLTEIALTADVAVAIADLPDPARVGQELTYSISVTNKGPQTAGNVAIVSILPEGVSFDSCNVSAGSYDISDDTITCTMGNLASGATGGVVIVVIPEAAGTITNAVSATTSSTDPVNGDNRAEAATVVLAPNRPPEITLPGPHTLPVGATTSFVVSASDPDHDPGLTLENTQAPAGATFDGTNFTWTAGAAFSGTTNLLLFVADDGQGADNSVVSNSTVIIVPYDWDSDSQDDGWEWAMFGTLAWGPNDDVDEDGALNWQERIAGTHPNLAASVFKVLKVTSPNGSTNHQVKVATEPERKYTIYFADQNLSNGTPWSAFADTNFGVWIETRLTSTNYTFTDDEGAGTTGGAPASGRRVYRVRVEWP
ncbi:MAG: hypothetical protein BWY59_01169 [Verrucomicrobia bacterium ADurb.Bin345]|nr:MAG: hypothetical protein BWY59_01169 [Verrucomicrobia bacterium ADurb.Bin345]